MPQNLKDDLTDWQALVENLQPHLADMPHLAADHAALSAVVLQGHTLEGQQDVQKANLRQVNQQRNALSVQGRGLKKRLNAGLRSALGFENERLLEFGIKPRPRVVRIRRPSKAEKAQQVAAQAARARAQAEAAAALEAAKQQVTQAATL